MRLASFAVVLCAASAVAQTWNSNAGAWNTGYGTVYGSFGYAMATQNLYNSTQQHLQRLMMRQAMIKQFGLAAVEKAEREAKGGQAPASSAGPQVSAPPPALRNLGAFKPGKSGAVAKTFADTLGSTPEEKATLIALVNGTKQAFEAQPETKAWRNNVAGALAFFLLSNVTVARDGPEPSDATAQAVFQALSQSVDETPAIANASAAEKQQLYETLLGFTGIPLAIYTEGKERQDAEQVQTARALANNFLQLVLKVKAEQLSFPQ